MVRNDDSPLTLAYGTLATVQHLVYFHRTGRLHLAVDELAVTTARFVTRAIAASDEIAREAEREASGVIAALTGS